MNDLEIKVLRFLWQNGPAVAKDIFTGLSKSNLAYSTLSFYLRTLENKGLIGHLKKGKTYRYHALLNQETFLNKQMDHMLSELFYGDKNKLSDFLVGKGWAARSDGNKK